MTDLRIFDPQQVRRIVEELEQKISEKNQRINELGEENVSAQQFIAALFERLCGWGMSPTTALAFAAVQSIDRKTGNEKMQ